jgi:hypothetical protein
VRPYLKKTLQEKVSAWSAGVRRGVGGARQGKRGGEGKRGEMTQTLYAHINERKRRKERKRTGGVVQGVDPEFKPQ